MNIDVRIKLLCLLIFISFLSFAQNSDSLFKNSYNNLNRNFLVAYESVHVRDCTLHSSIKPFCDEHLKSAKGKSRIELNGLFDGEAGTEKTNSTGQNIVYGGMIGPQLRGIIKNKFSFSYSFLAGNSAFPSYLDSSVKHSDVVHGMGSAYDSNRGYSFADHFGYLSFSPNKVFNFQIGKDRHFWGDGHRSLFLSDISSSFPFLKITTNVWKFKYVNLFAIMKDATASPFKNDFKNKYGTFHYLSWNATKRINLSLFESIIFQGTDTNRARSFDINYLNPAIFYRPVEYSLGSSDNAFLGFAFKIKAGEKLNQHFYGQLILDEFLLKEVMAIFKKLANPLDKTIKYGWWANKQGFQLGFRSFDLFTMKNLSFQTEINAVRPYTYAHGSVQQNYGHYNQPLAHPLGANFAESVSFLNYRYKKWVIETQFLYAVYGKNEKGKNWGQNIFESYISREQDYYNKFFQGLKTYLTYSQIKVGYYIIPSSDLLAEAGVSVRQEKNSAESLSSVFFFIGIKTAIMNRYRDY